MPLVKNCTLHTHAARTLGSWYGMYGVYNAVQVFITGTAVHTAPARLVVNSTPIVGPTLL